MIRNVPFTCAGSIFHWQIIAVSMLDIRHQWTASSGAKWNLPGRSSWIKVKGISTVCRATEIKSFWSLKLAAAVWVSVGKMVLN